MKKWCPVVAGFFSLIKRMRNSKNIILLQVQYPEVFLNYVVGFKRYYGFIHVQNGSVKLFSLLLL